MPEHCPPLIGRSLFLYEGRKALIDMDCSGMVAYHVQSKPPATPGACRNDEFAKRAASVKHYGVVEEASPVVVFRLKVTDV